MPVGEPKASRPLPPNDFVYPGGSPRCGVHRDFSHPALSYASATGVLSGAVVCPSCGLSRALNVIQTELKAFFSFIGTPSTLGVNSIDLTSMYGRASRDLMYDIPYPFTRRGFPLRIDGLRVMELTQGGPTSLIVQMTAKSFPDQAELVIYGEPVVPATAFINMVYIHRFGPSDQQYDYSRVIRCFKLAEESSEISISATSFPSLRTLLLMSA